MNTDNLRVKWIEVEASVWEAQQAEVKALREENDRLNNWRNWWCPDVCPITGLPFFMWITHHETDQWVPTYGGPYDSYTIPEGLHPDTAKLVKRFSRALANKLHTAEKKYGYDNGWMRPDWMDECREHLMQHIAKGDPRDVAAYCAFLWHHDASTASAPAIQPQAAAPSVPVAEQSHQLPKEPPPGLLMSMALRLDHGLGCPGYYDQSPRFEGDSHAVRLKHALEDMRKVYEEVAGTGFYSPANANRYTAMLAAPADSKEGK